MSGVRSIIRRWLGIPSESDIRAMILREIDADAVWREGPDDNALTHKARRIERARDRSAAILFGQREDTRRG